MNRVYELPVDIEELIDEELKKIGYSLDQPKKLATCVREMSDFYIHNPLSPTPWHENWAKAAQLGYYLPLNILRNLAVYEEGARFDFFRGLHSLVDFGSGLGAGSWWLSEIDHQIFVEKSTDAQNIHKRLLFDASYKSWHSEIPNQIPPKAVGLFSYSLTELKNIPKWFYDFEALMIVEPSTRQDGRQLLELRAKLLENGYTIVAPCTHQKDCPLLKDSPTDWCHDRIHFKAPGWFLEMESQLPFKNQTLTMSYLLARKNPKQVVEQQWARITGDRLDEKGKSRQMVCRGTEREFLSWLHRDGVNLPNIPRGTLIEFPQHFEKKSNEIRAQGDIKAVDQL